MNGLRLGRRGTLWPLVAVTLSVALALGFLVQSLAGNDGAARRGPASVAMRTVLTENFERYPLGQRWIDGTRHGPWTAIYNGNGRNTIARDGSRVLSLRPQPATSDSETHAALVVSRRAFGDFEMALRVKTARQLRVPAPKPWEAAWIVWRYTDNTHFYYVALKPHGWELGKEDPAYPGAQRFLAEGSSPSLPLRVWHRVRIRQLANVITVWLNGQRVATFRDTERPHLSGAVGFYSEDAQTHVDDVVVRRPVARTRKPGRR